MAARRYAISLVKTISQVSAANEWREERFRMPKRPCAVLQQRLIFSRVITFYFHVWKRGSWNHANYIVRYLYTAISINVVGSTLQGYATRPNGTVGSRGLLHVLKTYEMWGLRTLFPSFQISLNSHLETKYLKTQEEFFKLKPTM